MSKLRFILDINYFSIIGYRILQITISTNFLCLIRIELL